MDFVHLHCYTYATRSDGWLTPRGLCHSGFGWGEQATAITDRGTLWKAPEFVLETAKQWTRAIIGSEVQVIADGEAANGCHPLVLLVENERGYANLVRILNSTQRRGGGSCPLPLAQLSEYADGLIALSGGQQSPLADMVRDNQLELAYAATIAIAAPFGLGRFFVELQHTGLAQYDTVNEGLERMAGMASLPTVATVDLRAWSKYALGVKVTEGADSEYGTWTDCDHLAEDGLERMLAYMSAYPVAIRNTVRIANMCRFQFFASARKQSARGSATRRFPTGHSLEVTARSGLLQRLASPPALSLVASPRREPTREQYLSNLDQELAAIAKAGLVETLCALFTVTQSGRQQGMLFGPGCGASGSLVCFALGISDLDPLRWNLPNAIVRRQELPGTIDFSLSSTAIGQEVCREMLSAAPTPATVLGVPKARYSNVRSFVAARARMAGVSQQLLDDFLPLLPAGTQLQKQMALIFSYIRNSELSDELKSLYLLFRKAVENLDSEHPQQTLESLDFLVMPQDSHLSIPTIVDSNGDLFAQYEGRYLRQLDYPVVRWRIHPGLELLRSEIADMNSATNGYVQPIDLVDVPLDDPDTYRYLSHGRELHWPLTAERRHRLKKLSPSCMQDLTVVVALDSKSKWCRERFDRYVANSRGFDWKRDCPKALHHHLASTFGVAIFREQIEDVLVTVARMSRLEADSFLDYHSNRLSESYEAIGALCHALSSGSSNEPWGNAIIDHPRRYVPAAEAIMDAIEIEPMRRATYLNEAVILYWSAWLKVRKRGRILSQTSTQDGQ